MAGFGSDSKVKLYTLDDMLQAVLGRAILHFDFKIVWGFRDEVSQNLAYSTGHSTKRWPDSKHNRNREGETKPPCMATDIVPWYATPPHIRWNDTRRFVFLAGHIMSCSWDLGLELRWGGDWDRDTEVLDQRFFDLGHFEVVV